MAKPDKKKSKNSIKVNFDGVETRSKIEDGQYHCRVDEISIEEGTQAKYLKWVFEIVEDGKTKGRKLYYNTSLAAQALWNLRSLLDTLGVETTDDAMDLDLDDFVDLELMCRVEEEIYEGKSRPKVTDFAALEETASVEDGDDDDDEEERPKKPKKDEGKKTDKKDEPEEDEPEEEGTEEDDDDGKVSADEVREMDEDELADLVKKHKLKVDFTKITKAGKRIAAVIEALEAKDLLSEEE